MLPLQAGALLGPMAGTGMVTLVPSLSGVFEAPAGEVALAITIYMIPFALVQFFSGAIAQRLGARRTVYVGYLVFIAASVGCAMAPSFPLFLLARLVQGTGGAFLFPILMALVGEVVKPERLGRAIGIFGVTQTLGLTLGPLVAGLSEVHLGWRWFFVILGLMAVLPLLDFARVFAHHPETGGSGGGILALTGRVIRERRVVLLSLAGAGLFFAMVGTYTYLATWLKDAQGLAEDRIGLVLALAGAIGIPASALAGSWVDRVGRYAVGIAGMIGFAAAIVAFGTVPYSFAAFSVLSLALGWFAATAWTALNTLAVEVMPAFRKPVASVYNAFRFLGYSLAPPVMGLAYGERNFAAVCAGCAVAVAASAVFVALLAAAPGSLNRPVGSSRSGGSRSEGRGQ